MQKLTFATSTIVGGFWKVTGGQLGPDCVHDLDHLVTQLIGADNALASSCTAVPYESLIDIGPEHLFETQRLSAHLEVRCQTMPDTGLVLDRSDLPRFDLDGIRPARQPESLRPQGNRPEHQPPPLSTMLSAVDASMRPRAADCVPVVAPHAITMDERTLAGTVDEVFDRRDRHDRFDAQSRSEPYPRVGSLGLSDEYPTVRQAAWTPRRFQNSGS